MATDDSPFLSRWARRKALARAGLPLPDPVVATPSTVPVPAAPEPLPAPAPAPPPPDTPVAATAPPPVAADAPPALTLADVAELTRDSDYSGFVARGVTPEVKNAALKKLFTDPHFNVMDGLDTYIDDYGKPDPLPPGMLRQMVQSKMLGLFDDEEEEEEDAPAVPLPAAESAVPDPLPDPQPDADAPALPATADSHALPPDTAAHEDLAVQLQPDHDAGRAGLEPGAGQDPRRQH